MHHNQLTDIPIIYISCMSIGPSTAYLWWFIQTDIIFSPPPLVVKTTCWRMFQVASNTGWHNVALTDHVDGWLTFLLGHPWLDIITAGKAPLRKPLNVPRSSPSSLTLAPIPQNTKLALAVARQIKITCQDATLVLMTYVSMETWDDRLLEVRSGILREPCDLGEMEESRNWRDREERGLLSQKGSCCKENPLRDREGERERMSSLFPSLPSTITHSET